jgi:tetratricopeptide (TPR) repeat protein/TolB-like protein/predicted Ser/Thr protein kinase
MLTAGQSVSHFKVLGEINRGGMGIVYRAFDTRLEREIALKVLPTELVADSERKRRFVHEARAAAALSHPHIAVVYEIDEADGVTFIAMELIEGRQLSAVLKRERLPVSRVLTLSVEIAEGLARAHERGVTHRDLKPANLMITSEGHSKIIDFGLAKLAEPSATPQRSNLATTTGDQTKPGTVLGTTAYMSPEQARGETADHRTDIWSFGIVLYEMATGDLPFQGRSGLDILSAIIRDPTPRLGKLGPELSPRGSEELQRIIDKCLAKDPAERYQSMRDVIVDLRATANQFAHPSAIASTERRVPNRRAVLATAIVAGILALGIWAYVARRQATPEQGVETLRSSEAAARRSVAVIGFRNLSGRPEHEWLSTALSEMYSSELAAGETLRAIPGEVVARGKIELALSGTESFGRETLTRIRGNLGCDLVVVGSYLSLGESGERKIRLDLRLQDTQVGETIASITEIGTENDLLELVSRTGMQLRERLGVGGLSPETAAAVRAALPANQEATRLYAEGLARLRQFDRINARALLERAAKADPKHPLIHAALSEALTGLGYDELARRAAQQAFDLSGSLSRENKLAVEARYRSVMREWSRAVELYRALVDFFPDNLEYGLSLADAQSAAGQAKMSMATVAELRRLAPPTSLDPRIDLAEGTAAYSLSDFKRAQDAAARAAAKGTARGAPLLVARAKLQVGNASNQLGDNQAAIGAAAEAEKLFAAAGDVAGVGRTQFLRAIILREQGNLRAAQEMSERLLATTRETGDQRVRAQTLTQLGIIQSQQGDLAGSTARLRDALAVYRTLGDINSLGRALNNLAGTLQLSGALDDAAKMYEESLALHRDAGNRSGVGFALNNLAEVRETRGELKEAKRMYEESLAIRRELSFKDGIGYTAARLGNLLVAEGDFNGARGLLEESLAVRTELGARPDIAETQLFIANLSLEEGSPSNAEARAREALAVFQQQRMSDREAAAHEVLTRALLAQGKVTDARDAIERSRALTAKTQDLYVRFSSRLSAAHVQAAMGQLKEAHDALEATLADAEKGGFAEVTLHTRLALGRLEVQMGKGRARLDTLQRDATARGYQLIARKAAAR